MGNSRIQVFDNNGTFKSEIKNVGAAPRTLCISPGATMTSFSLSLERAGSEPGSYEAEIRDSNATVRASARGNAELRNYVSTLEVAVSLGDLSPGTYSLAVRRDGNDWQQFPIRLQ